MQSLDLIGSLASDTLTTFKIFILYILSLAACLIAVQLLLHVPKNIFRKLLHIIAFTSSIFVVLTGRGWLPEALTLIIFAALVYPALKLAQRWSGYSSLFVEKKPGEVLSSLLLLFFSQAALIVFACGFLQKPYILIASTASWGLGDIAAAWIGRPFGRHKIRLWFADKHKSWEGSIAMAVVAFAACLSSLLLTSLYTGARAVFISLIIAAVSSLTEMASKGGLDTVTVPAADAAVLALLTLIL